MSDPVTNLDIEDVLSSIRRLVSESARPAAAEAAPPASDRLVLTPALRVGGPAADAAPTDAAPDAPAGGAAAAAQEAPPAVRDPGVPLSDAAARVEAALTALPADWEPDGSEEEPVVDWSSPGQIEAPMFRLRHLTPVPQPEGRSDLAPAAAEADGPLPLFLSHRIPQDPPAGTAARAAPGAEAPAGRPGPSGAGAEAWAGRPGPSVAGADGRGADGPVADDTAADDDDPGDGLFGDGPMIDEDRLRAIITDVVRQELQGPLGERITRNIRKLVRREIYRVLTSEEFE